MPQLGPAEVLVILVVALLVFGPKRLPEVGRQVGRGLRELRKVQDTVRDEINSVIHHDADDEPPSYSTTPVAAPLPAVGAGSGRPAPTRFRPAATTPGDAHADREVTPALPAAPPAPEWPPRTGPAPGPSPRGAHAPSRFRAPGH
jgi:TatA/E family protein of Tat protein translocase